MLGIYFGNCNSINLEDRTITTKYYINYKPYMTVHAREHKLSSKSNNDYTSIIVS